MSRSSRRKSKKGLSISLILSILVFLAALGFFVWKTFLSGPETTTTTPTANQTTTNAAAKPYTVSQEEKDYLNQRFEPLVQTNAETIAYVYAPGTNLDEPVVQGTDNATYLDKTFDGGYEPFMGTVFMDTDNKKDFSDRLTWLFGHARGSLVPDSRMFNDVNFYSDQTYFNEHPYVVVETPERKFYYEAVAMVIVPENTAFYRTSFDSDEDFQNQLQNVYDLAGIKKPNVKVNAKDHYLVLSTCREDDSTLRANLYLRRVPDGELTDFLAAHGDQLAYVPTR
ncbi:class B sortase, LPKTxAVK-specific [Streptococcus himalayensis]|uniref:SrtB family sortase n=1 Tax=Streptococcus himalayensis TaxID=1888195 RepID=A0A917EGC0_9STRE|nr:class B sortase, LPKTxAVK-specific [Streptococcus himalayensis]GGE30599.1 SrtB family sortase [Streptococcus himalayensis]